MTNDPTLAELLSVPYLVEAETIDLGEGRWVRRVAYPELPGCRVDADTIEDALERLERLRVEIILNIVRAGGRPPLPRPPLPDSDPLGVVTELGFGPDVIALIGRTTSELSRAEANSVER